MNVSSSVDGVLLIDKPSGPTSHDVVARMRRALRQRGIGHTGTLDPLASGLLALVVGRATRLASILTGSDKTYDATVRLGFDTTTDDALGTPLAGRESDAHAGGSGRAQPGDDEIQAVLERFRGSFAQVPPAHSAKKVGGVKAYELARRAQAVTLTAVDVTVRTLEWTGRSGDEFTLRVTATAGFYVRALARDIGAQLGCGAHLTALRRVRSGHFLVDDALSLAEAERADVAVLSARLLPPADVLPHLAGVVLSESGLRRVLHGNWVVLEDCRSAGDAPAFGPENALVKLLAAEDGRLVALARVRSGALHPVVVLG